MWRISLVSGVGGARPRYFILNRFVMSHVVRSVGSAGQTARLPLPRAVSVPANRREHLPPTVVARIIPASARKLFKYSLVHRKMMEGFAVRMAVRSGPDMLRTCSGRGVAGGRGAGAGREQADAGPKWHPAPPPGAPQVRAGSCKGQAGGLQGCSPDGAGRPHLQGPCWPCCRDGAAVEGRGPWALLQTAELGL